MAAPAVKSSLADYSNLKWSTATIDFIDGSHRRLTVAALMVTAAIEKVR